jgi:hypothetical protein
LADEPEILRRLRRLRIDLAAVDAGEDRKQTLRALIALAQASNPADCWDDERAVELLRSQSSPDELRALGMSDAMIALVFAERHER